MARKSPEYSLSNISQDGRIVYPDGSYLVDKGSNDAEIVWGYGNNIRVGSKGVVFDITEGEEGEGIILIPDRPLRHISITGPMEPYSGGSGGIKFKLVGRRFTLYPHCTETYNPGRLETRLEFDYARPKAKPKNR